MRPLFLAAALTAFSCGVSPLAAQVATQEAAIRLNQVGFLPDAAKTAIMPDASRTPLRWQLADSSGEVLAQGRTRVIGESAAAGEHLHAIDFSDWNRPGEGYRLHVGERRSHGFAIGAQLFDRLAPDALAFFYHQRAGTPIEAALVGEAWARPAGHPDERATCFAGEDERGNRWPGCDYTLDVTGGWYDAGDHGKYVVNGGISLWTLLNLHERSPQQFGDGSLAVPERGNGVSDLLDEARWEMEWLLAMQLPAGTRLALPVGRQSPDSLTLSEVDAGGMAHQKVADVRWTALPMPPQDDPEERRLYPPTTAATLNLAAVAAQCARVWRDADAAFADRCLAAARAAWDAAQRNPHAYATGSFTGSGAYGDEDLSDEFYWAAAELLATTGEPAFAQAVRSSRHFAGELVAPSWPQVAPLGTLTLVTVPDALPPAELAAQRARIVAAADRFAALGEADGYGAPMAPGEYVWGSNSEVLNRAMLLAVAHDLTGAARYKQAVFASLDYLLGRNPLDRSYVAGWGDRPMRRPHHRFWARSLDPSLPEPPAGTLSGGPNAQPSDEASTQLAGCTPQSCWADEVAAYSLNEVTINWNAPLAWVAAWVARNAEN